MRSPTVGPNFVSFMVDSVPARCLGANGNKHIVTPTSKHWRPRLLRTRDIEGIQSARYAPKAATSGSTPKWAIVDAGSVPIPRA